MCVLDTLGGEMPPVVRELAMAIRTKLSKMLDVPVTDAGPQAGLLGKLVAAFGDPEVEVPRWLTGLTPLGIEKPIVPVGVFPMEADHAVCSDALDEATQWATGNYSSYEEHKEDVDANLREEQRRGRLVLLPTREALEAAVGPTTLSRIGVIAKLKADARKSGSYTT